MGSNIYNAFYFSYHTNVLFHRFELFSLQHNASKPVGRKLNTFPADKGNNYLLFEVHCSSVICNLFSNNKWAYNNYFYAVLSCTDFSI